MRDIIRQFFSRLSDRIATWGGRFISVFTALNIRPYRGSRTRNYYAPRTSPVRGVLWLLCVVVFLFCAVKLISYAADYAAARQASAALREIYHAQEQPSAPPADPPSATPAPSPSEAPTPPEATAASSATAAPPTTLSTMRYPQNPYGIISSRFAKLRQQNQDIIGWLTIDDLLDEAVVQRDNSYYLKRDYRGYHNVNGAIFLDEFCDLSTRPYTLMLYGHNMKTGAMFGCLRSYEKTSFYREHPFITFDTAYEDGRYVVFSVATVSIKASSWRYLDFPGLYSLSIPKREACIKTLLARSMYDCRIDVAADDQLLLLVTCTGDDEERRVVAARRIREREDEEALKRLVRTSTAR